MKLDLRLSDLKEIPQSVFRTEGITSLNLEFNEISEIPDTIGEMQDLEELILGNNRICEIHPAVFQLPKLRRLRLSRNSLSGVLKGVEFGFGPAIELDISFNQLDGLEGFRGCERLASLNACNNCLTDMRSDLFIESPRLESLHFGNNKLSLIPKGLFEGVGLQSLFVPYNCLQAIQSDAAELSNLRVLRVQGNRLRTLPRGMNMLEELIAHENCFSEYPDSLMDNVRLHFVDMCCNKMTCLPDWLPRQTALSTLILSRNRVKCLPAFLLKIPRLSYVSLADNPLMDVPKIKEKRDKPECQEEEPESPTMLDEDEHMIIESCELAFQKEKPSQQKLRLDIEGHIIDTETAKKLANYPEYFHLLA
jgi:Leucine-rich repeat (LRR) protein